jgi:ubiquinone/menaquinone biosynthesis C-methylase UbiE
MSVTQLQNRVQHCPARVPSHADPRIRFFDGLAPTWDQTGPDPAVTLQRLEAMRAELGLRPGQNLLEVGCGTGQVTGWLSESVRPGRVLSVDFSPVMLEQARRRWPEAEFALLDICAADELTGRFDVVWCFHVFPHLRDAAAALGRMAALLGPGGELVVLHLSGSTALNAFHHQIGGAVGHDRLPSMPEFEPLLEAAGFRLVMGEDREDRFLLRAALPA